MARQYKRDNRGRFSSTGSARSARPATRMVSRGTNRLTRDNAGRITSVGGQGATARGGRLRTASGKLRATQLVRMKGTGGKLRGPMGGGTPRISRAEPIMTGGTLAARSSLTRAKRKLEQNPTPAQRGAVTRAKKYAAASYDRNTQPRKFGRPASVMRKRPPEMPAWWGVKGGGGPSRDPSTATRVGKPLGGAFKKTQGSAPRNTMKGPVTLKGLQKAGGSRWQKNGMDRVYFNNVAEKAGVSVDRYKSGNIASAAIRGRGVSNAKAGEVLSVIGESKVYYDRGTRRMMTSVRSRPGIRGAQERTAQSLIASAARKLKKESRMKPKMWRKGRRAK
jgi:hypothetical protein